MSGTQTLDVSQTMKEARKLKDEGLSITASKRYLSIGRKDKAADALERGGWFGLAIDLRLEMGNTNKAIEDALKAKNLKLAAKLMESVGNKEGANKLLRVDIIV
ncbi:MAG TPA: hypothetical protein VMV00_02930 [Candidatus Baltobacteraceae bacterium]|nr:hypothetical protein [Candidatus Baltobacteraceae bacterium]